MIVKFFQTESFERIILGRLSRMGEMVLHPKVTKAKDHTLGGNCLAHNMANSDNYFAETCSPASFATANP